MTNEEQRRKARERQQARRLKIKQDPELHERLKKMERERWKARVNLGKVKKISEMNDKEKRKVRRTRQLSAAKYRSSKKLLLEDCPLPKKELGRRKKNLNRSSVARENLKLKTKVTVLTKQVWKYKKRVSRAAKLKKSPSPRSKVQRELGGKIVPESIKQKLVFAESIATDLKSVRKIKSNKVKQMLGKVMKFNFIRKYKMLKWCRPFLFNKVRRKFCKKSLQPDEMLHYDRQMPQRRQSNSKLVSDFFNRDDVSAVCPGKGRRNYAKLGGVLKRKRIMRGTLTSLYQKFVKEDIDRNIVSFATFCRMKPFYIMSQNVEQRRTCLCRECENFNLLCSALHSGGAVNFKRGSEVASTLCCESMTSSCAERKCDRCKSKAVEFLTANNNKLVSRSKWITIEETKEGLEKAVKRTIKRESRVTVMSLREEFISYLPVYLGHYFRFNHQNSVIRLIKSSVKPGTLVLHVDFSENWSGKYGEEIQSVYYGGSREQVILHQGVGRSEHHVKSFCTLSRSPRKDAAGIGAHLVPVLNYFFAQEPGISKLHIVSDSPTTQYRNKETFYMVTSILPSMYPQLTEIEGHFTEAGHGKGESDGVGGWAKTAADQAVGAGADIASFDALVECLKEKAVKTLIETVTNEDVLSMQKKIPKDLQTFKGTMKVHHYSWTKEKKMEVYFSSVSCTECQPGTQCIHFGIPGSPWKIKSQRILEGQTEDPTENTDDPGESRPAAVMDLKRDSWVAVTYQGFWYPGIIDHCTKQYVWVNFMVRHEKNNTMFLWPPEQDKQRLKKSSEIYSLNQAPVPVSRTCFIVPEKEIIDELAARASH